MPVAALLCTVVCMLQDVVDAAGDWLVVCVSGVTCGGKSTVTRALLAQLNSSVLLKQDDYYLRDDDPRQVQLPEMGWRNRELMTSLDMDRMRSDVEDVLARRGPRSILLLDGFMLYYDKYITRLCDLKFFLLLGKDACKQRRVRRNRRIPDLERYFEQYVWPAHLQYKSTAFSENPDLLLVDGGGDNLTILQELRGSILTGLRQKFGE